MTDSLIFEIDSGSEIRAVAFSANGKDLVSGDDRSVRVWRVEDTEEMETMRTNCLAVSKDGRWIAAGTAWDGVVVWDTKTYEKVFAHEGYNDVTGVDFSPDSTRLVASLNHTATIWDVAAGKQVLTLAGHKDRLSPVAVRYSPQGDRIAIATPNCIRLYDSDNGHLQMDIQVKVTPSYNTTLLWFDNHLFVISDSKIKQINASTGSTVMAWPIPDSNGSLSLALPNHGQFIACSTKHAVAFWDTKTYAQLGVIQHTRDVSSMALSPDGSFLAIGGDGGKITIHSLCHITVSIPLSRLHPTLQEPDFQIDGAAFDSWKKGQLADAEALLTIEITMSQKPHHHVFASRALVRARLQNWDAAFIDAEMAIKIQPSAIGYIAKSLALVGKGDKHKGYRACDIAFEHFHSAHVSFLLLIKAIVVFMAGEHDDAISRLDDLIAIIPFHPTCYVVQAYMYLLLGNMYEKNRNYQSAVQSLELAQARLRRWGGQPLFLISLISGWKFDDLNITVHQRLCEALYAAGHLEGASKSLLNLVNTFDKEVKMCGSIAEWVSDFTGQFLSAPEGKDDTALNTPRHVILKEWAKITLASHSWDDALIASAGFIVPKISIYRVICERLETIDRIIDAIECFQRIPGDLIQDQDWAWFFDFKSRCCKKLEGLGDIAMISHQYDDAVSRYSVALTLDPVPSQGLFMKRTEAMRMKGGLLNVANKVNKLDPPFLSGHRRTNAISIKPGSMPLRGDIEKHRYLSGGHPINPGEARAAIRKAVQEAIRVLPPVLINTISGRLLNKSEQAAAFESLSVFNSLISSMTAGIDQVLIERDVTEYYRYAMFSHRWEENEPMFEQVIHTAVYDQASPTYVKLQMFCKTVRDAGLDWAWSDTCCINKVDHFVLQEALVSMFKWYQGSAMTIVSLRDVYSPSRRGDLMKSIWNTRAWTFQEYHASKVVRFYNEDWTPYLNLDIPNHKESPEILAEMEEATGISTQALMALRPGLDDIRAKLSLASRRETTLIEDAAYSLFGIFSISLPIVYGEADQAIGRLLAQLLSSSGDTSILAWTGKSGSFNSCLPSSIIVFKEFPTAHVPLAATGAELTAAPGTSSSDPTLVTKLYDRLAELPVPLFSGKRMKLPCIVFKLGPVHASRRKLERTFRAQTTGLGVVEIRTEENLSRLESLYLVHPWIDFLLDLQPVGSATDTVTESSSIGEPHSFSPSVVSFETLQMSTVPLVTRFGLLPGGQSGQSTTPLVDTTSLRPPSSMSPVDKDTRALQAIARLRQPFGALLLTPSLGGVAAFRRVAAESLITVQVEEITPTILNKLVDNVRVLDVL